MRITALSIAALVMALPGAAVAQSTATRSASDDSLVANALSAAPASIASGATVTTHDGRVLRQGTSDWVCLPDMADVPNDSPMCLDAPWRDFLDALTNRRAPTVTQVGFAYMLQGDMPVSNTDPYATAPTAENEWIQHGDPHVMILVPDVRMLEGLPTDPASGGPYVMWKGTPYAHIMLPAPPPE